MTVFKHLNLKVYLCNIQEHIFMLLTKKKKKHPDIRVFQDVTLCSGLVVPDVLKDRVAFVFRIKRPVFGKIAVLWS